MSVALRRQRDGQLRPFWYGEHVEEGKRKVDNLGRWRGTPPPSLLGTGPETTGDAEFEESRKDAETALKAHADSAGRKGLAEHLTERLIESKTGRAVEYVTIADLSRRWRNLGREAPASEEHLANCDAHFRRFEVFMQTRDPAPIRLYEITAEDAAAYVTDMRRKLAPATAQYGIRLIAKSLSRFLPVGAANPFADFIGRRKHGESGVVHRKPFTTKELRALLDAARDDDFLYPLIVTATCTGMRRADVCGLKWADVDLAGGMLAVKTSKTEAAIEIPIFPPLRAVLETRGRKRHGFVFPEAAAMMRDNADGLSYRFKALVAKALDTKRRKALPEPVPASEIGAEGAIAINKHVPEAVRRDRMLDTLRRYCAGESVRQIAKATDRSKGTISYDLSKVEEWIGKCFMRSGQGPSVKKAIARVTRVPRKIGQKAASVRDWHALRTTFVTLALSAGVPMELVRRVTGHATVEVVLKHYFRPDREQFRAALTGALPDVLTGGKSTKRMSPAQELDVLNAKLQAGTATAADKKRLRLVAAKV
jgi:integrase